MATLHMVKTKPPLSDVVGKFMVVSQFCEPRYIKRNPNDARDYEWIIMNYDELDDGWFSHALPGIYDSKDIQWGHSTWLIGPNGDLKLVGADYDSSG